MTIQQNTVRRDVLNQRNTLSHEQLQRDSAAIVQNAVKNEAYLNAQSVGLYLAYNSEVATQPLISHALDAGKTCFLPTLHPADQYHLAFMPYTKATTLVANCYGIQEVPFDEDLAIPPSQLDCVFVPLVVFDRKCHRIGMGKGYYDRTFAFKQRNSQLKPNLIGLAYEFQHVEDLAIQPWDVALDTVITEKKTRRP